MKRVLKTLTLLSALVISINIFTVPASAYEQHYISYQSYDSLSSCELNVPQIAQQKSKWCWAASSEMVSKYLCNSDKTQRDIVKYIYYTTGNSDSMYPNFGGGIDAVYKAVRYATNNNYPVNKIQRALSYEEIKEQIIEKKLPIIAILLRSNGGHVVVICGVNLKNESVIVRDPWEDNKTKEYLYSDFCNCIAGQGAYKQSVTFD